MHSKSTKRLLRELYEYRVYLKYETLGRLKMRHTGTYLGYLWWILDPLLFMAIFYFVFKIVFQRGEPNYVLFLFTALLPWRWFSTAVAEGTLAIRSVGALIKQVYYPKVIPPLTAIFLNTINFFFGLLVLGLLVVIYRVDVGWNLLFLPLVIFIQFLFTLGLVLILADLDVFYKDVGELLRYALMMWFYLSPGFYPVTMIPARYRAVYELNPFATIFTAYRDVVMYDRTPDLVRLGIVALVGLLLTAIGIKIIASRQGNYAKVL